MPLTDSYEKITRGNERRFSPEENSRVANEINDEVRDYNRDLKRTFFEDERSLREVILNS